MRSIVPSVEKPAASARCAHSTVPRRSTPRTALGSPIPISMRSSLLSVDGGPVYGRSVPNRTAVDTLQPWARALLEDARVGHLGLLDGDARPRVLPVTFALVDGEVYSAVDDKPKQ